MKKRSSLAIATLLFITALSSSAFAETEKEIFERGIRNTLKLFTYEKEKALTTSPSDYTGKYCISLNKKPNEVILPFDVVKMGSLSLFMKYEPAYLSYQRRGESKNTFCFAMGDTEKEAEAKLVSIKLMFKGISKYSPKIKQLKKRDWKRTIAFLGSWNQDMSDIVKLINKKMAAQKEEIKLLKAQRKNIYTLLTESLENSLKLLKRTKKEKKSYSYTEEDAKVIVTIVETKRPVKNIEKKTIIVKPKKTVKEINSSKTRVYSMDDYKK